MCQNFNIIEIENGVKVEGVKDFNLTHIFECGQAFRWEKTETGSYIVVAFEKVIELLFENETLTILNTNEDDFYWIWYDYFDFDKDYSMIKQELSNTKAYLVNDSLKKSLEFGYGIRILNQDPFEMIISFIISANNQIPRIKKSIDLLSENYGRFIQEYKGKKYYAFPSPCRLAQADSLELKEITRVGFRNQRIIDASKEYIKKPDNFSKYLDDETLGNNLLELNGVGPKVRDCILLFGYDREKTFPVDVWVKRLMEYLYLKESTPNKKILEKGIEYFGDYRGYAQQYLFYYARENNIGK